MSKKCKFDLNQIASSVSCTQNKTNSKSVDNGVIQLASPVKAESDKKEYTTIQLVNGLKVLLISDVNHLINIDENEIDESSEDEESNIASGSSETSSVASHLTDSEDEHGGGQRKERGDSSDEKLAACSLTVGIGSFSDPSNIQGLAHFLEHMLFMGSTKYPKENEFDSYIKKKGGSDNASTECEYTTYYFECQEKFFLTAMDMFSNFFISPLLKKEAMTRERESIDSEFQMALPSDLHRRQQLICGLANNDNPAKKFTWGNLITLRDLVDDDTLHEAVKEFWKNNYSAHRMTLAVQARLPTETLKEWVIQCFSEIPSNYQSTPENPLLYEPFNKELFNKFYRVEAVQDIYLLEVNWVLPPVVKLYKSKPLGYISWLIGHEGTGSLTAYLRKKLWASSLTSGHSDDGLYFNSFYTMFSITIALSDKGRENIKQVLMAIFSYIKLIQNEGPNERIFKEIQAISEMEFRFSEEDTAIDTVEDLSENMQFYPPEDYIRGSELTFEYNPNEIKTFLNLMTPSNANIIFNAHNADDGIKYNNMEPWFKTRYNYEDIDTNLREILDTIKPFPEFHLPTPNEFIATNFDLLPEKLVHKYPQKCLSNELLDVYCRPDMKFRLPIGYIGFNIITPVPEDSVKNSALLLLYIKMVQFTLVEKAYPANMALLEESISPCERGLNISVFGFNDKLHLLLDCIANSINSFNDNVTEELFETYKLMTQRGLTNINLKVNSLAREIRMSLLLEKYWTTAAKHYILNEVNFDDVKNFANNLFKGVHVQCLVQGNFDEDRANILCNNFVTALKCTPLDENNWPKILVYQLPIGERCCRVNSFNIEDKNCITHNYYQYGKANIKEFCTVELLLMLMEEPLFDKLRTQEQLGYDVSCTVRDTFGILGFSIIVNSQVDKYSVTHVEKRITNFLISFIDVLKEMSNEEYEEIKLSLIKIKQCGDLHLKEEIKRNWNEINSCEYLFDRIEKEINAVIDISKDDVLTFLKRYALGNYETFRKLTIQVVGHNVKPEDFNKREVSDKKLVYKFLAPSDDSKHDNYFINDFASSKNNLILYPPSKIVE